VVALEAEDVPVPSHDSERPRGPIKPGSQKRLLDEVTLFLHQALADLPERKRQIITDVNPLPNLWSGNRNTGLCEPLSCQELCKPGEVCDASGAVPKCVLDRVELEIRKNEIGPPSPFVAPPPGELPPRTP